MSTTPSTPASPRPDSSPAAPPTSSTPDAPSDLRGPPPPVAPDSLPDTEAQSTGVPEAPSAAVGDVGASTAPESAGTGSSAPDVIVVDDSEPPSSQASPGRASARLQGKKAARVLRAAARKPKRVGPVSGVALTEARKKKRKAGTPAVPTLRVSTDLPRTPLSAPVATDVAAPPAPADDLAAAGMTAFPAARSTSTSMSASLPAGTSSGTVDPVAPESPVAAGVTAAVEPSEALPAHAPFDLDDFCGSFSPVGRAPASPTLAERLSLADKVAKLFEMFGELRRSLQPQAGNPTLMDTVRSSQPPPYSDLAHGAKCPAAAAALVAAPGSWTLPLNGNAADLPPAAICQQRCSSFELPRTRVKGEYYPPLAHQLAAHRLFRDLASEEGKWWSPMSFVLHLRELDCVRFDAPPAVLMALYSGRLGSRGLTVMHFRPQSELEQLQRGSTNANFSADFGAGATLPATDARCPTYEDLLAAIGGLISFGDALWYDHARRLLSRVKRFVLANMERDNNTPERVTLTLLYVNQFLGRALAHLLVDSPHWWREFCDAVRAVDYHSPDWQAALNGLALRMATSASPNPSGPRPAAQPRHPAQPRRGPASRTPIMPDHLRRQIPRDGDGREPCLRFLAGGMCYGGNSDRCVHHQRTHRWEGRLPRELQEFVDRHYGPDRRHRDHRPHA